MFSQPSHWLNFLVMCLANREFELMNEMNLLMKSFSLSLSNCSNQWAGGIVTRQQTGGRQFIGNADIAIGTNTHHLHAVHPETRQPAWPGARPEGGGGLQVGLDLPEVQESVCKVS